ncbi:OmpA family protein [Halovulum sp. GXIMD14793]
MSFSKMTLTVVVGSALALSACTNPDGTTNNTGTGAAIGGLLGAVTGAAVSDNDRKGAVIGGIAGAALGAGVGNYLDRQQKALQRDIGGSGAQIINTGDKLVVRMPEGILFATESANVKPAIRNDLIAVARNLNEFPNSTVQVVGHTDNTGSTSFNQNLSERRAQAVSAILRQGGVSGSRLAVFGLGESQPIASNGSAAGRAQNRRVEIVIIPR